MIPRAGFAALLALGGCVASPTLPPPPPPKPVEVQILAINDFHGNLEPPRLTVEVPLADGSLAKLPAGGVAHLATAAKVLREGRPHSVTVSAGDLIGATPLTSALYLDEPTIAAMDLVGIDFNAVGNHEFDKGSAELRRMQDGGCEKYTTRQPCAVEPFTGAGFKFLAANVFMPDGRTFFPGTAIKDFGQVQLGVIGMTLKETATLVTPAGVAGLTFADEAASANASVATLKAAGADAIVLVIHQGGASTGSFNDKRCPQFQGDIVPILDRLVPAIDVVVSGHTHAAYVCEFARAGHRPLLLTSAGRYGTLITDIRLRVDPIRGVTGHRADNVVVQSMAFRAGRTEHVPNVAYPVFAPDPQTARLVSRYVAASTRAAARVIGNLSGPVVRQGDNDEYAGGNLIADAQLAAARKAGAEVAFINSRGIRADIIPAADGSVTFGQIFAMQPFGNSVVVKTLTGAQIKTLLETQFAGLSNFRERANMLFPSRGFFFAYDLSRPEGQRVLEMRLNGKPIERETRYRVAINNFLASGGDGFAVLNEVSDSVDAGLDLDALEAWIKPGRRLPDLGRIEDRTPGR